MKALIRKWQREAHKSAWLATVRFFLWLMISNTILIFAVFTFFAYLSFGELRRNFERQSNVIAEYYRQYGIDGLEDFVAFDQSRNSERRYLFTILDENSNPIVGNLGLRQDAITIDGSWISFYVKLRDYDRMEEQQVNFLAMETKLHDGRYLQIATYIGEAHRSARRMVRAMLIGGLLAFGMSVIVISRGMASFLSRLEPINRDIEIVKGGDLTHRLEVNPQMTELDRLAVHVNDMLDRIEELIDGVKQVSDNIAHDLRTPLTRLRNNLASYERKCSEQDKEQIRSLIEESDQLISTFNALLRIARIELSETRREWSRVQLHELVSEVIDLYEPLASDKGISLTSALSACEIEADRDLIFQAVANLLDNAIKYTPSGGKICVDLNLRRGNANTPSGNTGQLIAERVELAIRDTGCGIQQENIGKVFRRFYREDSSRGREPGNGLGLSLVAAVAKIHRATIEMENAWPGLNVFLSFPAIDRKP